MERIENEIDGYEDNLGTYIVKITTNELTHRQNEEVYRYLHAITDLERISDYAMNIAESAQNMDERNLYLKSEIHDAMRVMESALTEVLTTASKALIEADLDAAKHVEPLEELIDGLCDEMKHRYMARVRKGEVSHQNSLLLNDLIIYYERISDHCSNIAVALIELDHDDFDVHNYIESLRSRKDEEFDRYFEEYRAKYFFADDVEPSE